MAETTKVQINASLRFNPTGELIGRDLLLNFREDTVDNAVILLSDFSKKFNLNLGISPTPLPATKPLEPITPKPALPTRCKQCGAGLVKRTVKKFDSKYYGRTFLSCSNYRSACMGLHWL